jgi:hypothetical protein
MRPVLAIVTAVGTSQWIPINYLANWYGVTVAIIPDSAVATIAASLQYTYDELGSVSDNQDFTGTRTVSWTRSGTTLTVTDTGPFGLGHGASVGDSVILQATGSVNLNSPQAAVPQRGDLGWTIAGITSPTIYTITVTNAGGTAGIGKATVLHVSTSTTVTVATNVKSDGFLQLQVQAVRLSVGTLTGGNVSLRVTQGMGH